MVQSAKYVLFTYFNFAIKTDLTQIKDQTVVAKLNVGEMLLLLNATDNDVAPYDVVQEYKLGGDDSVKKIFEIHGDILRVKDTSVNGQQKWT